MEVIVETSPERTTIASVVDAVKAGGLSKDAAAKTQRRTGWKNQIKALFQQPSKFGFSSFLDNEPFCLWCISSTI